MAISTMKLSAKMENGFKTEINCSKPFIIDTLDWSRSKKLGPVGAQFGNAAFTAKLRKEIHRNLGAYMTPQAATFNTPVYCVLAGI